MAIKQCFLEVFKGRMKNLKFNIKGKVFHRVVNNEIVELISYTTFSNRRFTIQFEIVPFCCGCEFKSFFDGTHLINLVGSELAKLDFDILKSNDDLVEWNNDEHIYENMKKALICCEENLFPYLYAIVDLKTYLIYMDKMYSVCGGMPLGCAFVCYPNLKMYNFDIAKKSRKAVLEQNEEAFRNNGFATKPQMDNYLEIKHEYELICEAADKNDIEFVDKYIYSKEQYSMHSYYKNFKQ